MKLDFRSKSMAAVMALAILLVLPLPDFSAELAHTLVVLLLWITCLTLAAVAYFKSELANWAWAAFTVATIFQLLIFKNPVTLMLSVVWKLWLKARVKRIQLESMLSKVAMLGVFFFGGIFSANLRAAEIPDSLKAHKIEELASCSVFDQIPWTFRKGKRSSRFIIRDKLRLSSQPDFSIWEIHQVLDGRGMIAYVFKHIRDDGVMEALVTKEASYNRILEKGKSRKIAEVRSFKNLVDHVVLTFQSPEGGSVLFMPGLGGQVNLQINFSGGRNRLVPPILLSGRNCTRVVDPDSDKAAEGAAGGATVSGGAGAGKSATPTVAAPAAGAAGGAAP